MPRLRPFPALGRAGYRRLALAQLCVEAGLTAFETALLWQASFLGGSLVGLLYAFILIPGALMSHPVGRLADRLGPRRLLVAGAAVMTVTVGGGAAYDALHGLTSLPMAAIAVLVGVGLGLWSVPSQLVMSLSVTPEEASNAIGLSLLPGGAGGIVGGAVGGFVLSAFGGWESMLVGSAILLGAGLLIIGLPAMVTVAEPARLQFRRTMTMFLRRPAALTLLLFAATTSLFLAGRVALYPLLVAGRLHGGSADLGLLVSANGAGSLLGALVTDQAGRRLHRGPVLCMSVATAGLCLALLSLSAVAALSVALSAACAATWIGYQGTSATLVQLSADPGHRGQLIGAFDVTRLSIIPVGTFAFGYFSDRIGATAVGLLAGLLTAAVGALALAASSRLRRLDALTDTTVLLETSGTAGDRPSEPP